MASAARVASLGKAPVQKYYQFILRGRSAAKLYASFGYNPSVDNLAFLANDTRDKRQLVRAARKVAKAEEAGKVKVVKRLLFATNRTRFRKSRSGYQVILGGLCLGWEASWGSSSAENRCAVCGWPLKDRQPPREIVRNRSDRIFSSEDGYLVVHCGIVDRLDQEEVRGVSFAPVRDPDARALTVSVYSGSFEGNRRRLLDEFPAVLRSTGVLSQVSPQSVSVLSQALNDAIEDGARSEELTGVPEDTALIRLPPWIQGDPAFLAFERFLAGFEQREMMSTSTSPPPRPGREAKWYALVLEPPAVPEEESTAYDPVTACPECGLRPALAGPLRLLRSDVQGREIFQTASGWLVASDRVCRILREHEAFMMHPVTLVG